MITVNEKKNCFGCTACFAACPCGAIREHYGRLYAVKYYIKKLLKK